MTKTAIIAGAGGLPALLARAMQGQGAEFAIYQVAGFAMDNPDALPVEEFMIERLAMLFQRMGQDGIDQVVFAGAITRPNLNPEMIDPQTAQQVLPHLLPLFQQGDDALLRGVIAVFEEFDFKVVGASDVVPGLLPAPGALTGAAPEGRDATDLDRAQEILATLGPLDLGQGVVVAAGQCLAIETLPGTRAMLDFVAHTRTGQGGVFVKAPKAGQDRRIDLPAIGPDTVDQVAKAGLSGIVLESGGVMVLNRTAVQEAAEKAGIFIWVQTP